MRGDDPGYAVASVYDAFVSYSHAADGRLAVALRHALHRFACPFYKLRSTRVFLDHATLSNTPKLWRSIQKGLDDSSYFVLLASTAAANSNWVTREVQYWLEHKLKDRLLIVQTDGEIVWDEANHDFDWSQTTALPQVLRGVYAEEPRHTDLRAIRTQRGTIDLEQDCFHSAVADLAAVLLGRPKDELIGDDVRQNQRTTRVAVFVSVILLALALAASLLAIEADSQRESAQHQRNTATARQLSAQATLLKTARPDLARQLFVTARRIASSPELDGALLSAGDVPQIIPTGFKPVVHLSKNVLATHADGDGGLAFLSNGRALLVAGAGSLRAYDVDSLQLIGEVGHYDGVAHDLTLDSTAHWAAIAQPSEGLGIFDVHDPKNMRLVSVVRHDAWHCAWQPHGDLVAIADRDAHISLWNVHDVEHAERVDELVLGRDSTVFDLQFSPNGKLLSVTSEYTQLFEINAAGQARLLADLPDDTRGLAVFSPDNRWLATLEDRSILLWDISEPDHPRRAKRLIGEVGHLQEVRFSPDGRLVASASEQKARVWELQHAGEDIPAVAELVHNEEVRATAFSPDSTLLATRTQDDTVRVWRVADPRHRSALESFPAHAEGVSALVASAGHSVLATSSVGSTVKLWTAAGKGAPTFAANISLEMPTDALALSRNGHLLATTSPGGHVELRQISDPAHARSLATIDGGIGSIDALAIDARATLLAMGDSVGQLRIVDIAQPQQPKLLAERWSVGGRQVDRTGAFVSLAFHPRLPLLVGASIVNRLIVWNITDPSQPVPFCFDTGEEQLRQIQISQDGRLVASVTWSGTVRLYEISVVEGLREIALLDGHGYGFNTAAFDLAGERLVVSGGDGNLHIYDIRDAAHPVLSLLFRASGADASAVMFGIDGHSVLVGARSSERVGVWTLDVERMSSWMCRGAGASISKADWNRLLPGYDYEPPCKP